MHLENAKMDKGSSGTVPHFFPFGAEILISYQPNPFDLKYLLEVHSNKMEM